MCQVPGGRAAEGAGSRGAASYVFGNASFLQYNGLAMQHAWMGVPERGTGQLDGSQALQYEHYAHGRWQRVDGGVVREGLVRLHVNGRELATLMCTPIDLDFLALGFLRGEGIIQGVEDVRLAKACPSGTCVEVWLRRADFEPPARRTITSGCGGGITFADLSAAAQPLKSALRVAPRTLCELMQALQEAGTLYQEVRGLHTAALAADGKLVAVAEDVGRHNTIDKLWGRCLIERIPTQDRVLLSTGRISSEMLHKAAHMGVPIVASRTSPTSLSVALANAWNITLAGYVRRDSLNVYTGQERIIHDEEEQRHANS
jgi:FdhD protein